MPMLTKNGVYWSMVHWSKKADKRAKLCFGCKYNNGGWCGKHKDWCSCYNEGCKAEQA